MKELKEEEVPTIEDLYNYYLLMACYHNSELNKIESLNWSYEEVNEHYAGLAVCIEQLNMFDIMENIYRKKELNDG